MNSPAAAKSQPFPEHRSKDYIFHASEDVAANRVQRHNESRSRGQQPSIKGIDTKNDI